MMLTREQIEHIQINPDMYCHGISRGVLLSLCEMAMNLNPPVNKAIFRLHQTKGYSMATKQEDSIKIRLIIEATNETTNEVDTDLVSTWHHKNFSDLGLIQDTVYTAMRKLGK